MVVDDGKGRLKKAAEKKVLGERLDNLDTRKLVRRRTASGVGPTIDSRIVRGRKV